MVHMLFAIGDTQEHEFSFHIFANFDVEGDIICTLQFEFLIQMRRIAVALPALANLRL